jgi:hypothetical protein
LLLEAAARRAERLGVGGDEVLRCFGILTPEQIVEGVGGPCQYGDFLRRINYLY